LDDVDSYSVSKIFRAARAICTRLSRCRNTPC